MTVLSLNLEPGVFWDYSVSRYTRGDMAPLAILLQDNHNVNVNVLLLLGWCLENNFIINLPQFKAVIEASSPVEKKLRVHRAKRKEAHPDNGTDPAVYATLKAEELELERQQQRDIVAAFNEQSVVRLGQAQLTTGSVFNASVAAFINAYGLRDNAEARRLVSLVIKELS